MPHDSEHDKGETSGPGSSSDEPRLRTSDNVVKYLQASFYYGIKGCTSRVYRAVNNKERNGS